MAAQVFSAAAAMLMLMMVTLISGGAAVGAIGIPNCNTTCGDISVPYPFGMGPERCYWRGFNLTCDRTSNPPRLLLGDGTLQVVDINLELSVVTVLRKGDIKIGVAGNGAFGGGLADDRPYTLSSNPNELVLVGCDVQATLMNGDVPMSSCSSLCEDGVRPSKYLLTSMTGGGSRKCSGRGCCVAAIAMNRSYKEVAGKPVYTASYDVQLTWLGTRKNRSADRRLWPTRVFVAEAGWFEQKQVISDLLLSGTMSVPVTLDWEVFGQGVEPVADSIVTDCPTAAARDVCKSSHTKCVMGKGATGYTCSCDEGYQGNPYITGGCTDIDECQQEGPRLCLGECINTIGSYECGCPPGTHTDSALPGRCVGPPVTARCNTSCGNVSVPYPFGMGPPNCYWEGFNLTCDTSSKPPRLLLDDHFIFRVIDISIENTTVRVLHTGPMTSSTNINRSRWRGTLNGSLWRRSTERPYSVSTSNEVILTGCNVRTLVGSYKRDGGVQILGGCSSLCPHDENRTYTTTEGDHDDDKYSGPGYCQGRFSVSLSGMPNSLIIDRLDSQINYVKNKKFELMHPYSFIAEEGWFDYDKLSSELVWKIQHEEIPMLLDWEVLQPAGSLPPIDARSSKHHQNCPVKVAASVCKSKNSHCRPGNRGYTCHCNDGYHGNPYQLLYGCTGDGKSFKGLSVVGIGICSGAGLLLLVLGAIFVTRKLKQRRAKMLRRKFFKQHRGHLLQQLVSQNADIAERMIIPLVELDEATNNFDKAREIGGGGHGTVYKGILSDLHVVAIKKSKVTIQREIDEFINEVAILSQINHRNVVKLFGCCLETKVPLLVYEFISNGTLYHHLHVEEPASSLPWEDRLRIATETAKALAYLHSAVSFPIVHRDIKSQNILLDSTLIAKVSDFGASRCIPVDETAEVMTAIQGTLGYLDPMYYYTGRLTEKSDVYSFGVLLMELLTRKKPCSYRSSKEEGLVKHFTSLLAEGGLVHVLDPQVVEEGGKEVEEVAVLAVACVRLEEEHRPSMRQAEMKLESLGASHDNVVLRDLNAPSYAVIEGKDKEETSRQYSLEDEYLLSSRYPR